VLKISFIRLRTFTLKKEALARRHFEENSELLMTTAMSLLLCSVQRKNRLVRIGDVKLAGLDRVSFVAQSLAAREPIRLPACSILFASLSLTDFDTIPYFFNVNVESHFCYGLDVLVCSSLSR